MSGKPTPVFFVVLGVVVLGLIGFAGSWTDISSYMPEGWDADPVRWRSATAGPKPF